MDLNTSFWGNAIQLVRQRKIPGLPGLLISRPGSCPPPHHPQVHTSPYWKKMQCHYLAPPITSAHAHQFLCVRTKKRDPSAAHGGSQAAHTSTRERPLPGGLGDGASCVQWGPSVGLCRPGRASGVNAQAGSQLKQQQVSVRCGVTHLFCGWHKVQASTERVIAPTRNPTRGHPSRNPMRGHPTRNPTRGHSCKVQWGGLCSSTGEQVLREGMWCPGWA